MWLDELPTLAHLEQNWAGGPLHNGFDLLPGTIWPMLNTGIPGSMSGLYYHPAQLRTGSAEARPLTDDDLDGSEDFWSVAAANGRHVTAIDPIQSALMTTPGSAGQIVEWGTHDSLGPPRAHPGGLLQDVVRRFGHYPVTKCDHHDRSDDGYLRLLRGLVDGAARKAEVIGHVLAETEWELGTAVLTEAHCAGHQLWHFHDEAHPWHDPATPEPLRSSLFAVYRALDGALGRVLEHAGPDTSVVVVASHGIEASRRAPTLLPAVLERLGYGPGKQARLALSGMIPGAVKRQARRWVTQGALNRMQLGASSRVLRFDGSTTRALAVGNGAVGAIRLNLRGREPNGSVDPGTEADALLDDISEAVSELRDLRTGELMVQRTVRAVDEFGTGHHPDLPDLLIEFRRDLGRLDGGRSPRLGVLREPVDSVRSGDHHLAGQWWIFAPGIPPAQLPSVDVLDVAPTVLDLVGVEAPEHMTGQSRVGLLTPHQPEDR